jgi:hypothetical protein
MNSLEVGNQVYAFHNGEVYRGCVVRRLKLTIEIQTTNRLGSFVYLRVKANGKQNDSGKHKTSLWPYEWLLYDDEAAKKNQ